ncbi:MAG TPA: aspartate-semialdehyde dehydrogenase [Phycisphaerales bacterium]|nr:aspartate-semialdehyde dehydrogenase [Phycisphaerales bacterium]HMP37206.1 aspartate-semialdehyde dehydrogenase [Phycisphaerales bacterium]
MSSLPSRPAVAIVGATGAVGAEFLRILEERSFPMRSLKLLASARSAGRRVAFAGEAIEVEPLGSGSFDGVDLALFSAGRSVSAEFAPVAVARGATVVDNSSCFRMDPRFPLVTPEVNGDELDAIAGPTIIANPNCSTIVALVAVTPLHRAVGVDRMVVCTYQAASGAGAAAMAELEEQARDWSAGRPLATPIFGRPYLFNLFSHNSAIGPDGYNEEERKLECETRRMWRDDSVRVAATCIRVPVLRAHSEAINLTFRGSLDEEAARGLLRRAPGVRIVDDRAANRFPEPIDAAGGDDVLVGRIRADRSQDPGKGLELFVCGDQIRKGAALNAVQIAERLLPVGVGAAIGSGR